jgi:hypothetical protein
MKANAQKHERKKDRIDLKDILIVVPRTVGFSTWLVN